MQQSYIHIKGARTHNLKNIDVHIPIGKFVVITGVSGSGKSSLAFDTLYAEGHRRYVESLSAYARQFLGRMQKPEVDFISGIPPAIAIQQKKCSKNPRSTVGTYSEIYDYLKLLYARIGHTVSPISGREVKRHTIRDVVDTMQALPTGTRLMLLAPIVLQDITLKEQLTIWQSEGYTRLFHNGTTHYITDLLQHLPQDITDYYLLIDRIVADREASTANRFADSVQTAFYEGHGACVLYLPLDNQYLAFSTLFEADGIAFAEPTRHLFDFNSPLGACPTCNGFGNILGIDPDLVVPDKTLSIYEGAIACWHGEVMSQWQQRLLVHAHRFNFPVHTPFYQLTDAQKQLIWTGNEYFDGLNAFFQMLSKQNRVQYRALLARYKGKTICPDCNGTRLCKQATFVQVGGKSITELITMPIRDLYAWFQALTLPEHERLIAKQLLHEIISRLQFMQNVGLDYLTLNRLSGSLSGGESQRLNLAKALGSSLVGSLYVLDEPSIGLHPRDTQRLIRVLHDLRDVGNTVVVVEHDEDIMRAADYIIQIGPEAGEHGGEIVYEGAWELKIKNEKLKINIDTDKLTSGRVDKLTSGRVDELTSGRVDELTSGRVDELTSGQVDELTSGRVDELTSGQVDELTSGRVDKLTSGRVDKLTSGRVDKLTSGRVDELTSGRVDELTSGRVDELTSGRVDLLTCTLVNLYTPQQEPILTFNYIELLGVTENNLKAIDVRIPLNVLTVVTGVSGSGKSSLIMQTLYPALCQHLGLPVEHIGSFSALKGSLSMINHVEALNQNPIGTSTRSNPVTYIKAYDDIRALFAEQQMSKQMGYTPAHFSFNTVGGRCEECKGEGTITIPMQFMADVVLQCEHCHGRRFKQDILEVHYREQSIYDILQMTVSEAIAFFQKDDNLLCKRIAQRLQALQTVGLGYLKLGQPSSTLSGGENQRIKLAYLLSTAPLGGRGGFFIFDEPTTGLHYRDIQLLLKALHSLIAKGHTVVVIEHHPAVIMAADYVIDLGPEGGENGGNIVFTGPPQLLTHAKGHTSDAMRKWVDEHKK